MRETRGLRPVINWRLGSHAPDADDTLSATFARFPFHVLVDEEEARVSVSGMAGKLWALGDTFVGFDDPQHFCDWSQGGYVKVAIRHEVREHPKGAELTSEVRLWCTSRGAQLRFRPFWTFIAPFSKYIGSELLVAAARRAERSS